MDEVCDLVLEEERAEPDEVDRNGLEDAEREVSARELGPGFRHRAEGGEWQEKEGVCLVQDLEI